MTLSVLQLVGYSLMQGSIDTTFRLTDDMAEGTRIHKMLQKQERESLLTEEYIPEVPLSRSFVVAPESDEPDEPFEITLVGRTDAIMVQNGEYIIDEIKTLRKPLDSITEPVEAHLAQARCYACIYALDNGFDVIGTRITYCNRDTLEVKYFYETHNSVDLLQFVMSLLSDYIVWAKHLAAHVDERQRSLGTLVFPFPAFRKGQRELAAAIYRNIKSNAHIYVEAPTGIGKTMSSIFPALKAMGEGHCDKIFYLTAKTTGREMATSAVKLLQQGGGAFKAVAITAKDKICFLDKPRCFPDECPYADGYYDRVKNALTEAFLNLQLFTRDVIEDIAQRHRVCPYEFSLDISLYCDIIICDYNYAFDPRVYLRRFFMELHDDYAFLVDEAHNLPDRAREMFSAVLTRDEFDKQLPRFKGRLANTIRSVSEVFVEYKYTDEGEGQARKEAPTALINRVTAFMAIAAFYLADKRDEELLNLYFNALIFVRMSEFYGDNYVTYIENGKEAESERDDISVTLFCIDPSNLLRKAIARASSSAFFSATLTPAKYFMSICGDDPNTNRLILPSPFPPQHLSLSIANKISTQYKDRENTKALIASLIHTFVNSNIGNYMVFFPSYAYMRLIYTELVNSGLTDNIMLQVSGLTEAEQSDFLDNFVENPTESHVAFAVLGGAFAEGVDLVGDRLCGVAVVGVGLPMITPKRDIIKDYYNEMTGSGFNYAYQYPGFNKVTQAAGRLIRSESDKGALLLIDSRFTRSDYKRLFPRHWDKPTFVKDAEGLAGVLERFWN